MDPEDQDSLLCHQVVLATSDQGREGGGTGALGAFMKGFLEKEEVEAKIRRNKNHRNSKQVHGNSPHITGPSETQ